jgi:hypothetical protein
MDKTICKIEDVTLPLNVLLAAQALWRALQARQFYVALARLPTSKAPNFGDGLLRSPFRHGQIETA